MAASPTPPMTPPVATPRRVARLDCALVKPDYPPQSLRRGQAGTVVVELDTDVAGRVSAARIVTSSGYEHLDEVARAAVLASHCRPYAEDGRALPARADVPVTFNLDE
ncbi:energy transducer TonB [Paraburkholderia tagetis]|uniref:Energy transducer TonB n=1 Tax=Paraburkholderia tagetis TaxID=2913261 RepID=A0A9X1UM89_9BURK|nr:energy transducer TonB [Paraburkholderia tagetis]MCG5077993.1 energy transducer TonB [Paraburkholderia tagetis]